ncbi:MAG TPA: hypothetical protein VF017_08360 [Thermoanaerobaculia bacterium]|nr:hypothetical protein [Thermoanaerobaculia bacterium]
MNDDDLLLGTGLDGETGRPLGRDLDLDLALRVATGLRLPPAEAARDRREVERRREGDLGGRWGVLEKDLASSGWAVLFPAEGDPEVRRALEPLLALRREEAGRHYRQLEGPEGYRPGEGFRELAQRLGLSPDAPDPERFPCHLLLVGGPEQIPFEIQERLGRSYNVGRLAFDTAAEHGSYARSVVAQARGEGPKRRELAFFGARNPGDGAMAKTCDRLVAPLARRTAEKAAGRPVAAHLADAATKARLGELLGGAATPALLFAAAHGISWGAGHPRQREEQGALVCQDFPGDQAWAGRGPIPPEHTFAAADLVGRDADLSGLVAFLFACHGWGTPELDAYPERESGEPRRLAPAPLLARLPQRLLAHPGGGALAVIGHLERTWGYSFLWKGLGDHRQPFEEGLDMLLDGLPVGAALEPFRDRALRLRVELAEEIESLRAGEIREHESLVALYTAAHDARNYFLLGDPAVKLAG